MCDCEMPEARTGSPVRRVAYQVVRLRDGQPLADGQAIGEAGAERLVHSLLPLAPGEQLHIYASAARVTLGEVEQAIREHRRADALALLTDYAAQRSRS